MILAAVIGAIDESISLSSCAQFTVFKKQ